MSRRPDPHWLAGVVYQTAVGDGQSLVAIVRYQADYLRALVSGPGQFSLALVDTVDKNEFRSRQGDRPPLLVVTTSAGNVSAAAILETQPSINNSNSSTIYLPLVIK